MTARLWIQVTLLARDEPVLPKRQHDVHLAVMCLSGSSVLRQLTAELVRRGDECLIANPNHNYRNASSLPCALSLIRGADRDKAVFDAWNAGAKKHRAHAHGSDLGD